MVTKPQFLEKVSTSFINIHQRRYLGNKYGVLNLIKNIINEEIGEWKSFCDIFAGTGVVGNAFNDNTKTVISNDLLYANYISLYAFLSDEVYNENKVLEYIACFNNESFFDNNYFSENFGNLYYDMYNAKKIGHIRQTIENLYNTKKINFKEKSILITTLIYAMDKIAHTVGHYDAYIKKNIPKKILNLQMPLIDREKNKNNYLYNQNANELIKTIECDILYIDPPYNSRQYCDAYHLLENLALWQKPSLNGVAKKFDRTHIKSEYNLKNATIAFKELIDNAKCKYILFSYNNMADKGNNRSNARISDEDIYKILNEKGNVKVFEQDFKEFTTGKSSRGDNKERVFLVEVKPK